MNDTTVALLIVLGLLAIVNAILSCVKSRKAKAGEDTKSVESAQEIALSILSKVGLKLFTDAEIKYGVGTGQLKMSDALANLIALLPAWVTQLVDKDWLQAQAEHWLELAKEKWLANPALIGKKK